MSSYALPTIAPAPADTKANGSPWRIERMKKAKGAYFILSRGRAADRQSIALGYATPSDGRCGAHRDPVASDVRHADGCASDP